MAGRSAHKGWKLPDELPQGIELVEFVRKSRKEGTETVVRRPIIVDRSATGVLAAQELLNSIIPDGESEDGNSQVVDALNYQWAQGDEEGRIFPSSTPRMPDPKELQMKAAGRDLAEKIAAGKKLSAIESQFAALLGLEV